ncbi:hypothetical protein LEN26_011480 [Aphanomyces euteiches]|nr:hypothetical protein LEN26_011480 [Aphanomyces euteiches]
MQLSTSLSNLLGTMRTSLLAVFATWALVWSHDQPNDSIAEEDDAISVALADQINRGLRGNDKKFGPDLSKEELSGRERGRKIGRVVGGGLGTAAGAAAGLGIGMAGGPPVMIAAGIGGGVAGRIGGELAGKKVGTWMGGKIGRRVAIHSAKMKGKLLKAVMKKNPQLKAISDRKSRISMNHPRPVVQRLVRSNTAPSSMSLDMAPTPNPTTTEPPRPTNVSQIQKAKQIAKR